jgi:molybdopterin-guanine dinucleotide biosynthesis protein A
VDKLKGGVHVTDDFVGIILAGGQSRRFGSPKAIAKRDGIPFYQYSVEVLTRFCSSTVIVTNPTLSHLFQVENQSVTVVNDDNAYKGQGPLAGIYSGMNAVIGEWYIVLPIDVPFIEEWVIQYLVDAVEPGIEAIVPIVSDKQQPLIAVYHHSVKDRIVEQLSKGNRSMNSILTEINVKKIKIEADRPFININKMDDYQTYID